MNGNRHAWRLDRFEAVLFDMDGVITDSMPFHCVAWQRLFQGFGIRVSREEILRREGESGEVTLRTVLEANGQALSAEQRAEALSRKEAHFRELVSRPALFQGAGGLIRAIHDRGRRLALVTGTSQAEARSNMPDDLLACFDALISGDQVRRGKPDPEPYRTALTLLKTPPDQALVIENAPYGIRSAKAAGVRCIAVTTSLPASYLSEADRTVGDLAELRALLFPEGD